MQALWGEPWTARSVFVDGNEVVPFRGDVKDLWLLAKQCTVKQWRQGPVERRRKWWPPRVLTRPFRRWGFDSSHWLFLSAFVHLLQTLPKEVSRSTATQVESGISDPNRRSLVSERRVKKDRMLVEKSRSSLSQRAAEHPMQWVKKQKNRALAQASFREKIIVIQSQGKAMPKYGICAGFWFGFFFF